MAIQCSIRITFCNVRNTKLQSMYQKSVTSFFQGQNGKQNLLVAHAYNLEPLVERSDIILRTSDIQVVFVSYDKHVFWLSSSNNL